MRTVYEQFAGKLEHTWPVGGIQARLRVPLKQAIQCMACESVAGERGLEA